MPNNKKDYKREYLQDYIGLTGIADLTLQDVYGAMILLIRQNKLDQVSKSLWAEPQFRYLFRQLLDTDNVYNNMLDDFRKAVEQTRYDRLPKARKQRFIQMRTKPEVIHYENESPDEDMVRVSNELLKQDDVWFDD